MDKSYQYRALLQILKGGYPGEIYGVNPADTSWHTTNVAAGNQTYTYYYRDSDAGNNANSSQVNFTVQDEWAASIDDSNNLTINVNSKILSITRSDVQGIPNSSGWTRTIIVRQYAGGPIIRQFDNDPTNTAHTISGEITLPPYSFTLAPGEDLQRGTIYIFNYASEYSTTQGVDEMWAGISFINTLPKDYRPGMVWDGSNWMSCNRSGGVCQIWNGTAWEEMRTQGYPTEKGNPPLLYRDGDWWNMAKIGQE